MSKFTFKGKLVPTGPEGAWTYMQVPPAISTAIGIRGRIPVAGTLNGFAFRNSLMPNGDGSHSMMFGKEYQEGARAKPPASVDVVLEVDTKPRQVEIPEDLAAALAPRAHAKVRAAFSALAHSHQKAFVDWINSAKRPETRATRVARTLELVAVGKNRAKTSDRQWHRTARAG